MENKERFAERLTKIQAALPALNAQGILICKEENKKYLTGFCSTSYYIILTEHERFLLTDSRYFEAAENNVAGLTPVLLTGSLTLLDFLESLHLGTLAVEEGYVTYLFHKELQERLTNTWLVPSDGLVERCRIIKDEDEIRKLRKAESIGDQAFTHILGVMRAGVSEKELALELEFQMRRLGASGLSFETIFASGERSSLVHGTASDRVLKHGDFITMDFGCIYEEYCSDMTRTVALSYATAEMEQVYGVVKEAQAAGVAAVCEGKSCQDVDRAARDIIECYGYGGFFGHGLGHGVGLEIHEAPIVSFRGTDILSANMAITVEPGIYLPGKFGVRIEDMVIVKKDGYENLSFSDKDLIIVNGG